MPAQGGTVSALPQSERDFQTAVIQYARLQGWLVAHFHDSRRQVGERLVGDADAKGFPDLVLVRDRLLIRELKSDRGRLSVAQMHWLAALKRAGVDAGVWRPADWREIQRELAR
jgi:hypothetical protein